MMVNSGLKLHPDSVAAYAFQEVREHCGISNETQIQEEIRQAVQFCFDHPGEFSKHA